MRLNQKAFVDEMGTGVVSYIDYENKRVGIEFDGIGYEEYDFEDKDLILLQ
ncbi:hypothetical protein P5637_06920 [Bacillus paralicheniformis]|uniref:Uncharacterized protein n=2 Tax=Bacillus subtilis group TaxID=653685 RepID=A0AB37GF74_BACLI|nr:MULTISPECIES: hypothetical protein [Bacillus]MCM3374118.1 hypothetical protein [Bacillus licheniformis]MCM3433539.1 hypothetical protein [Bacillus licheniformis]MCM3462027.1 hypothetical protein [Bacillus licheniformis]MCM3751238.1 hypothetical protein [Bacillus licheniformis]MCU4668536.1 hypothetical protein [Bacillus paralicheniformis]